MHVAATLVAEGLVVHLKYEDVTTPYRVGTDTGHTRSAPRYGRPMRVVVLGAGGVGGYFGGRDG
jgi:hypothetical protein